MRTEGRTEALLQLFAANASKYLAGELADVFKGG
jgi:hypothetical protein